MARYLDPKNDFIFKRIFGSHPNLLISFLNALMPFEPGRRIESLEYIPNEMVPDNPAKKFSIVDVRCKDNCGRHFIVEMQMEWSRSFPDWMLFNTSKTCIPPFDGGKAYDDLQPVYALGIINENYDHKTEKFYHRYQFADRKEPAERIGFELILIELQKFRAEHWADRKMAVLWLRFLRDVQEDATSVSEDLLTDKVIREALDICEEGAFTPGELAVYDKYWDSIRVEKTLLREREAKGRAEGEAKGREESTIRFVRNSKLNGLSIGQIQAITDLAEERILEILRS